VIFRNSLSWQRARDNNTALIKPNAEEIGQMIRQPAKTLRETDAKTKESLDE
jgi:fructose-1-phosphate kinase PfkB-like protein